MNRCKQCEGVVPAGSLLCPNCHSNNRAWWRLPLTIAGAGFATVTLSACYGSPCAANILPDGGTSNDYVNGACGYDCTKALADGGNRNADPLWIKVCLPHPSGTDGGCGVGYGGVTDGGGAVDGGGSDGGVSDGGTSCGDGG